MNYDINSEIESGENSNRSRVDQSISDSSKAPRDSSQNMEQLIDRVFSKRRLPEFDETGFHRGPRDGAGGLRLAVWNWVAALIDTLLVISMTLLLASFVSVTPYWGLFYSELEKVLPLVGFAYIVMLRILLGRSIGEWACGLRLGDFVERKSRTYPVRVILRSILVFSTGLILLPLVSLLMERDLTGRIVGLELKSRNDN